VELENELRMRVPIGHAVTVFSVFR
jgi:hypothetical protein